VITLDVGSGSSEVLKLVSSSRRFNSWFVAVPMPAGWNAAILGVNGVAQTATCISLAEYGERPKLGPLAALLFRQHPPKKERNRPLLLAKYGSEI
jgi:uncharacterized protein YbdZ (MbtH family)